MGGCYEVVWERLAWSSVAKRDDAVLRTATNRGLSMLRLQPGRARLRSLIQLPALRMPVLSGREICFPPLAQLVPCCPGKETARQLVNAAHDHDELFLKETWHNQRNFVSGAVA